MSVTRHRIRLKLTAEDPFRGDVVNEITGAQVEIPRAADVAFELALFFNDVIVAPSNFATIALKLKTTSDRDGTAELSGSTASFTLGLTEDQWEAGDEYHALITFTNTQTALGSFTDVITSRTLWLVVYGTTSDSPAREIPLLAGEVKVVESGYGGAASPDPTPAASYYTKTEADARFGSNVVKMDNAAGFSFILRNDAGAGILIACDDNQELTVTKLT